MRRALTPPPRGSSRLGGWWWTFEVGYYRRRLYEAVGSSRYSKPALFGLDDILPELLGDDGFFVEAGGNDGFQQSNTYHLEHKHGWRGLLVEPIPRLAARARLNRPRARVEECALVDPATAGPAIEMHDGHLMSFVTGAQGTAEGDDRHARNAEEWMSLDDVPRLWVQTQTLTDVLVNAGAPSAFEFLSLDLEGYEPAALRGLDFERFAPRHILVEISDRVQSERQVREMLRGRYDEPEWLTPHDLFFRLA